MTPAQKLVGLAVVILVLISGAACFAWLVQDWRMGKKLAEQAGLHKDDLAAISNAAGQAHIEHDKRLDLEGRLQSIDEAHFKEFSDAQKIFQGCVIAWLLLICGCQSALPRIQPVAAACLPPPAPSAWFMQPVESNLTQRVLNELPPSPTTATTP